MDLALLQRIFDSIHDALFVHRLDGTVVAVNDRVLELYQITREMAPLVQIGEDLSSQENPTELLPEIWKDAVAGEPQVFPWVARRPGDGFEFPVEVTLRRVIGTEEPLILASVRPASERTMSAEDLELRFRSVALASSDWIFETDTAGKLYYVSERVREYLGYQPNELLGHSPFDLAVDNSRSGIRMQLADAIKAREPLVNVVGPYVAKDGHIGYARINAVPSFGADGAYRGYLGVVKDITREYHDEVRLKLFAQIHDHAIEGITVTDPEGTIVTVNAAFSAITGYSAEEAIGQNPRILRSEHHDATFYEEMWSSLTSEGSWQGEIWNRRKSGDVYPEWLSISSITDADGRLTHYVAIFHDISDMKAQEAQIRHQALHDALTGLPNRSLLIDRLQVALQHARRTEEPVAVLFADLDGFKNVNDTMGHSAGDEVLRQTVERFGTVVREEDTLARIGGDEFVVVIGDPAAERIAISVAQRILDVLRDRFVIREREFFLSASIGISLFPGDGQTPEDLVKNADLAMYRAKSSGRARYSLFTDELDSKVNRRLSYESLIRRAIEHEEFVAVVQPQVRSDDRSVHGVETLVRWRRPDGTLMAPGEFIDVAEETSLIVPIDRMMLRHACRLYAGFSQFVGREFLVSVNVSAQQLRTPNLATVIGGIIESSGIRPEGIELEVTETAMMTDLERAQRNLAELAELGVQVAIDDFGTGYSSLAYLKRLPIHALKIDQSFLTELPQQDDAAQLVTTIVAMAKALRLKVVAEGVENERQVEFLRANDVDLLQGYLFSVPISPPEFEPWYRAHEAARAASDPVSP